MRFIGAVLLLFAIQPNQSFAQHNFGAGIVIGDPTGLTAKYVLNRENAIDATLAFRSGSDIYLHGTYLWRMQNLFNLDKYPISWYFGIGSRLISYDHNHDHHHGSHKGHDSNDLHLAARTPAGLRMNFKKPRIELFTEAAMALDIIPDTDFDFDFGIGARYYF